jgi:hypothetical protein
VIHELERLFRTPMFQPLINLLFKDPLHLLIFRYLKGLENPVVTRKPGEDDNIWTDFKARLQRASDLAPQQHAWADDEKQEGPEKEIKERPIISFTTPAKPHSSITVRSNKLSKSQESHNNGTHISYHTHRASIYTTASTIKSTATQPSSFNTEKLNSVAQIKKNSKPYG